MPGRTFFPFVTWSLWQGPDHLLWVSSAFFKERYYRFYYNDIQALVLQRTNTHLLWTFIWASLALLFGIISLAVSESFQISLAWSAVFIIALLINVSMGASCSVFIQTAVQRQKISSLRRLRKGNKTIALIKTLVEERQGAWEREQSVAAQNTAIQSAQGATGGPTVSSFTGEQEAAEPRGLYKPLLHQILFGLFLVLGLLGAIQLLLKSLPMAVFETLLQSGAIVMVIVALVRWFRHLKGTLIAKINWLALVFLSIYAVIGYGLYMIVSFRNPDISYHNWAMFKMMFELQMADHPLALASNIIYTGGSLLLGAFGMLVVHRYRQGKVVSEAVSS